MKSKKCTRCGKRKSVSQFHHQSSTKDGYKYECKDCNSARALKFYYAKKSRVSTDSNET